MLIDAWDYLWNAIYTHPFNAFTLLFAASAVSLSFYALSASRRQARASERQATANEETVRLQAQALQSQADNVRRSLDLAERSATASERSAESTRFLVEVGQRPWVSHVGVRATVQGASKGGWHITANSQFENSGKTPAFELQTSQWLEVFVSAVPYDLQILNTSTSSATLGPGSPGNILSSIIIDGADMAAVQGGLEIVCLYGIAAYRDVLEKQHRTTWCLTFDVSTSNFAYADKHNTMT
jgi:hypothetical protein